jgi:hypothetical protein
MVDAALKETLRTEKADVIKFLTTRPNYRRPCDKLDMRATAVENAFR